MSNEDPWLASRAGRQFQILIADRLAWLEWVTLGPAEPSIRASRLIRKSIWRDLRTKPQKLFHGLLTREHPPDRRPNTEDEFAGWLHEFLTHDWNDTYREIGRTGSFLGYLSGYLSGELRLPPGRVAEMGLQQQDIALRHRLGVGMDSPELLVQRMGANGPPGSPPGAPPSAPTGPEGGGGDPMSIERIYAIAYAERSAAEWIAVYDENGERAGRPYEIISKLFRQQVVDALRNKETLEQLRSRMVFPDLLAMLESGEISEAEYAEWTEKHLNRDFYRFALTEASFAWNNGRLAYLAERGRATGSRELVQFTTGGRVL